MTSRPGGFLVHALIFAGFLAAALAVFSLFGGAEIAVGNVVLRAQTGFIVRSRSSAGRRSRHGALRLRRGGAFRGSPEERHHHPGRRHGHRRGQRRLAPVVAARHSPGHGTCTCRRPDAHLGGRHPRDGLGRGRHRHGDGIQDRQGRDRVAARRTGGEDPLRGGARRRVRHRDSDDLRSRRCDSRRVPRPRDLSRRLRSSPGPGARFGNRHPDRRGLVGQIQGDAQACLSGCSRKRRNTGRRLWDHGGPRHAGAGNRHPTADRALPAPSRHAPPARATSGRDIGARPRDPGQQRHGRSSLLSNPRPPTRRPTPTTWRRCSSP